MMRKLASLFVLTIINASACGVLAAQPAWWMDNIVKIEAKEERGAGVVLADSDKEIFVLTAWHVIDGAKSAAVTFHASPLSRYTVVLDPLQPRVNTNYDIAVFAVPKNYAPAAPFRPLISRGLTNYDPGKPVSLVGFPGANQDWKPVINANTITSVSDPAKPYCFSFTKNSLAGGFSGTPVLDQGDNFLGLMIETGTATGSEAYAVKANEILDTFATMRPNLIIRVAEETPVLASSLQPARRAIIAGLDFHCVVVDGDMYCWGNDVGRWVGENMYRSNTPWKVLLPQKAHAATASLGHICALMVDGNVACWGYNDDGRVNGEKSAPVPTPRRVELPEAAIGVSVGGFHSCALGTSGKVYCWGNNRAGALGTGSKDEQVHKPAAVPLPVAATQIAAGGVQACALTVKRSLYCWGQTTEGEALSPKEVAAGFALREISAADTFFCGITTNGETLCIGRQYAGVVETPPLKHIRVADVPTGDAACGLGESGSVDCWDPTRKTRVTLGAYADIAPEFLTCAINDDGDVDCWGSDSLFLKGEPSVARRLPAPRWKTAGSAQ